MNPRIAEVCSQCGSHDLSLPQPKVPFWWKAIAFVVQFIAGIALAYVSLAILIAVLKELLARPEVQGGMIVLALLLIALWCLWSMTPHWIRKLILKWTRRRREGNGHRER